MNNKILRLTILLQVLFFIFWGGWEWSRRHWVICTIYVDTMPVDPRDLLAGQYMALRYPIGDPANVPGFPKSAPTTSQVIKIRLAPGPLVNTDKGQVTMYVAEQVDMTGSANGMGPNDKFVWVQAKFNPNGWNNQIEYGIERYYFSERRMQEMNKMRSGQYVAKVDVSTQGLLTIKEFVKKCKT